MDKEKIIKYIDFCIIDSLKDEGLNIQYYYEKMQYYNKLIEFTKINKPLFFQKRKLIKYNRELLNYEKIVKETSLKLIEEINFIEKIQNQTTN